MKKREQEELSYEEKYKNSRRGGIALIVIGVLAVIAMIVVNFVVFEGDGGVVMLGYGAYAALFILIGAIMLAIAKKKYKKAQEQAATAAQTTLSNVAFDSSDDDDDQVIREANGKDLHDIIANAANVEKVTFTDDDAEFTFDFLWCNRYNDTWYMVVGRTEEDDSYMKYILRVDKTDSTFAHYEMNDGVRDVIIADFARAVEGYAQQNGYTAQATSGEKQGRLARMTSRFKSGAGEEKKTRLTAFISVAVMYAVILVVGLALYFARIRSAQLPPLVIRAIALGYLLVMPSFLLYFGAHNPFNFNKSISTLLIVVGIVAMIACDIYGVMIIPRFAPSAEQDVVYNFIIEKFIPIALFVATVAYVLVYLVWCKNLSSKWFAGMSYATTILFPVATALILAAIALYVAWILLMWLINAIRILLGGTPMARGFKQGWTGERSSGGGYQIIDEHGYTRTLTHYEGNRYRDDTGSFWVSDDGGNSFRRD